MSFEGAALKGALRDLRGRMRPRERLPERDGQPATRPMDCAFMVSPFSCSIDAGDGRWLPGVVEGSPGADIGE